MIVLVYYFVGLNIQVIYAILNNTCQLILARLVRKFIPSMMIC